MKPPAEFLLAVHLTLCLVAVAGVVGWALCACKLGSTGGEHRAWGEADVTICHKLMDR